MAETRRSILSSSSHTLDALVLGAGIAGCNFALRANELGAKVTVLEARVNPRDKPCELLKPECVKLLPRSIRALIGSCTPWARNCNGVLSRWGSDAPEFQDHEMLSPLAPVLVSRSRLDQELRDKLFRKKILVSPVRIKSIEREAGIWLCDFRDGNRIRSVSARRVIDATGRSSQSFIRVTRRYYSSNVAFSLSLKSTLKTVDSLVMEATSAGWWYLMGFAPEKLSLVFVTSAELAKRGKSARAELMKRSLASCKLFREYVDLETVEFQDQKMHDARMSALLPASGRPDYFHIGDSALALDPLAGKGCQFALESSNLLSQLLATDRANEYQCWLDRYLAQELDYFRRAYLEPSRRIVRSEYWAVENSAPDVRDD